MAAARSEYYRQLFYYHEARTDDILLPTTPFEGDSRRLRQREQRIAENRHRESARRILRELSINKLVRIKVRADQRGAMRPAIEKSRQPMGGDPRVERPR